MQQCTPADQPEQKENTHWDRRQGMRADMQQAATGSLQEIGM